MMRRKKLIITADKLRPGQKGTVISLKCEGAVRRHIIDMGITPGATLVMCAAAPMGDPLKITVRGYALSLRRKEAQGISVRTEELVRP